MPDDQFDTLSSGQYKYIQVEIKTYMEITAYYDDQGHSGLELSLGLDQSQALIEAVAQKVLTLCDQDKFAELTVQDNEVIDNSIGKSLTLRILDADSIIRDLFDFHDTTPSAINSVIDGRHRSKNSQWKINCLERLRMGKTALHLANTIWFAQVAQDQEIVNQIFALGVFDGPSHHEDATTLSEASRSSFCPHNSELQGCGNKRRQRHSYCSRVYEED